MEKAGKGQLTDRQIWEVWHLAPTIMGKPGLVAQLLLALGGVRQEQLITTPWEKIKLEGSYPHILLTNTKGRSNYTVGGRDYMVPLNQTAVALFTHLKRLYGHCVYPFPGGTTGHESLDKYMSYAAFNRPLSRFQKHLKNVIGSPSGWFTIGMIRGSISTRMNEAGVSKMIKEKIAGHNQKDVTTTHYDMWEYKKEKREATEQWESYLKKIISLPYEEVTDRLPEEME